MILKVHSQSVEVFEDRDHLRGSSQIKLVHVSLGEYIRKKSCLLKLKDHTFVTFERVFAELRLEYNSDPPYCSISAK